MITVQHTHSMIHLPYRLNHTSMACVVCSQWSLWLTFCQSVGSFFSGAFRVLICIMSYYFFDKKIFWIGTAGALLLCMLLLFLHSSSDSPSCMRLHRPYRQHSFDLDTCAKFFPFNNVCTMDDLVPVHCARRPITILITELYQTELEPLEFVLS